MKIAVYGAGGVGGHFGGLLAVAGAEVHLIARGAHLAALRNNGLSVHSVRGDFVVRLPATSDPADIGPSDYVLFCVKSFDTDTAAAQLEPLVGEDTAVLSLQNGVETEDRLAGVIGYDHVMAGLTFIFLTFRGTGSDCARRRPGQRRVRRTRRVAQRATTRFLDLCVKAGIEARIAEDIRAEKWDKFAFITAQAGMTSAVRLPIGDIRSIPECWMRSRELQARSARSRAQREWSCRRTPSSVMRPWLTDSSPTDTPLFTTT